MSLKHLFSHSDIYSKYRITYPESLFQFLRSLCLSNHLAWDVGTGTGQAAIALATHFNRVIASDINANQIAHCPKHIENIQFKESHSFEIEHLEKELGIGKASVDLVLVARAVHWFPLQVFHNSVQHVLKDSGIYAILTYILPVISPSVDAFVKYYHDEVLHDFWAIENKKYVHTKYENIDFPFEDELISIPEFYSSGKWNLAELLGYLNSWSATQRIGHSSIV
jgi:ubiquinone/menaquinone biosynthesis C-methylase UbiE